MEGGGGATYTVDSTSHPTVPDDEVTLIKENEGGEHPRPPRFSTVTLDFVPVDED